MPSIPDTQGFPSSLHKMAKWDILPPDSHTIPEACKRAINHSGEDLLTTRILLLEICSKESFDSKMSAFPFTLPGEHPIPFLFILSPINYLQDFPSKLH